MKTKTIYTIPLKHLFKLARPIRFYESQYSVFIFNLKIRIQWLMYLYTNAVHNSFLFIAVENGYKRE